MAGTFRGVVMSGHGGPTTKNRQGNDFSLSYRSAIFYPDDEQRRVAEDTIADVEALGM